MKVALFLGKCNFCSVYTSIYNTCIYIFLTRAVCFRFLRSYILGTLFCSCRCCCSQPFSKAISNCISYMQCNVVCGSVWVCASSRQSIVCSCVFNSNEFFVCINRTVRICVANEWTNEESFFGMCARAICYILFLSRSPKSCMCICSWLCCSALHTQWFVHWDSAFACLLFCQKERRRVINTRFFRSSMTLLCAQNIMK